MSPIQLLSLQVGQPRTLGTDGAADPLDRPWTSATLKEPVAGPVWLGREGLAGDGQADRKVHGGPEKAVLAYASEHYAFWRQLLGREDVGPGGFGENLTLVGLTEADVCIGDSFRCGEALLQVSQPRQPCWKQARRWRRKDVPLVMETSGRVGWYFRVIEEGHLEAGAELERVARPCPEWTVERTSRALHGRPLDRAAAAQLADVPWLSPNMRASFETIAAGGEKDPTARLYGAG
jgi:MOSC domain-containing protein YiiM